MRRAALIAIVVNSLATAAFSQQTQVSIFYTQLLDSGGRGYAAALSRQWTPRISTAISVGVEDPDFAICTGGIFTPLRCRDLSVTTYPVDLSARFHFPNDTRWHPYVGAGVRYLAAPDLSPEELQIIGEAYSDEMLPEAVGGFDFLISPRFALSVELKALTANTEDYDSALKLSAGVSWRF